ncbi:nucleotide pyrophosphohydrolase [Vibrio cyclitrophicus]|uniref:nucleotide pyrophosphohydrolase n=1 Tax=Vibrio cyclitrophicus TaxID=47951 RepID=UPI000C832396|nr:nucleotide pyrophosphohydrolase [Vibrio cyclitrophicus]MCC4773690.1 nucleotide pyrophosphohydrolase [Vibrio cyclitrophicus]MCC4842008.1 nucleotide pyrophosphohydrolase [Vibrio cyclitrophicus]PME13534.1 nucleotide pyrophosphohydrolase [Vibrio cyclitrophicus]PME53972.1 nucleotide pyrophosphohydrolase [Vibrio cyclitrophicus]PME82975.1 nucleotide pyrophosphohydrolase [Vibrio cyclitrophicus]
MNELQKLQSDLAAFAEERDWDKFHSPKNLAMALAGESGELLEHFQWLTEEQSNNLTEEQKVEVANEVADIFMYLLRFSDKTGINLLEACAKKLAINAEKYPVSKSFGVSTKYTKL